MLKVAKISSYIFTFTIFIIFSMHLRAEDNIKVRLQLKWKHQFQFAGYYAANEKGFYRDRGIDVEIIEEGNGNEPVKNVIEGRAEFGIGNSDLLIDRSKGKKVVVLAPIFQHSPYIFITKKSSRIDSVYKFVGKKVALEKNAAGLLTYLKYQGVPIDKLNIVSHSFSTEDLIKENIDVMSGYSTDEVYDLHLKNIEINIFSPVESGVDFYGDTLFTSESYLKNNRETVEKFLEASIEGWKYALNNRKEIAELIYSDYTQRHSIKQLMAESDEMIKLIIPQVVEVGYCNRERWYKIADSYRDVGLVKSKIDFKGFFYEKAAESIEKKLFYLLCFLLLISVVLIILSFILIKRVKDKKSENS